jgi:hypothetical protein
VRIASAAIAVGEDACSGSSARARVRTGAGPPRLAERFGRASSASAAAARRPRTDAALRRAPVARPDAALERPAADVAARRRSRFGFSFGARSRAPAFFFPDALFLPDALLDAGRVFLDAGRVFFDAFRADARPAALFLLAMYGIPLTERCALHVADVKRMPPADAWTLEGLRREGRLSAEGGREPTLTRAPNEGAAKDVSETPTS